MLKQGEEPLSFLSKYIPRKKEFFSFCCLVKQKFFSAHFFLVSVSFLFFLSISKKNLRICFCSAVIPSFFRFFPPSFYSHFHNTIYPTAIPLILFFSSLFPSGRLVTNTKNIIKLSISPTELYVKFYLFQEKKKQLGEEYTQRKKTKRKFNWK